MTRTLLFTLLLASAVAGQSNVLVIVPDDLGVDRVGVYAAHPDPGHTPVLDQLAAQGVLFRNAWASPVCSPARSAMLTGRYAFRTGIGKTVSYPQDDIEASLDETYLPALLPLPYLSAAVGKWHLSTEAGTGPTHPLQAGFDQHHGAMGVVEDYFAYTKWIDGEPTSSDIYATTDTVDDTLDIIEAFEGRPWFVWVAFNAPHEPFHAPPPELHGFELPDSVGEDKPLHYQAMVEAMDTEIGRLLASIDPDVLADTYVIVMADNGTPSAATTAPWDPHHAKGTIYEGGLRVPLIVSGPGVVAGAECQGLVDPTDLFATVLDIAGVAAPPDTDGVSFRPYLTEPETPSLRSWAYSERFVPNGSFSNLAWQKAVRGRRFKLVHLHTQSFEPSQVQLYDLIEDPLETVDLMQAPLSPGAAAAVTELEPVLDAHWGTWATHGLALAGLFGEPLLTGEGSLEGGTPVELALKRALPGAPVWLVLSPLAAKLPFKGGTLVPDPGPSALVFPMAGSPGPLLTLDSTWPEGMPPGSEVHLQFWVLDAAAPLGLAASNGIRGKTP